MEVENTTAADNTEIAEAVETTETKDESIMSIEGGETTETTESTPKEDESIMSLDKEGEETSEEKEEGVNEFTGSPETYEAFELPENFELDEASASEVNELFKKLNLSQKGGQELINAYARKLLAVKEAELTALAEQRKAWRKEIQSRPAFASERATVLKGLNAVVKTPAARQLFTDSWLCDHPALFDTFLEVGELLGEDTPIARGKSEVDTDVNLLRFPQKK